MIEEIFTIIINNIELVLTFLAMLVGEFICLKLGKKDKANKLKQKRQKLLKKLNKKHQKTQAKYIKEEEKIQSIKEDIKNA